MTPAEICAMAQGMTSEQLEKALHCLGWRRKGSSGPMPGRRWAYDRNYYCAPDDDPVWLGMDGRLREREPGDGDAWRLTALGIAATRVRLAAERAAVTL